MMSDHHASCFQISSGRLDVAFYKTKSNASPGSRFGSEDWLLVSTSKSAVFSSKVETSDFKFEAASLRIEIIVK